MPELTPLYNSQITCPVCMKEIQVTKVRSKFIRLVSKDEDFCPHYESRNPVYYEAWICGICGYAAHSTVFPNASRNDAKMVLQNISSKWTSRSFTGERDINQALEAFKIVLYNLQVRGAPFSEFGKVCLRIAWLYRYKGDWANEQRFMKFSFDYYKKAFTGENLRNSKLDDYSCMYIIAELGRRLDLKEESMLWFGKLISASANPRERDKIPAGILENAKDQIYQLRQSIKKEKEDGEADRQTGSADPS